jgi:deoxyribose-phosphate aldolase
MTDFEFARTIDSTFLTCDATENDIVEHCKRAMQCHFFSVAIATAWIPMAGGILKGSDVGIDAPIGFPCGYSTTEVKVFETVDAFAKGATEADVVINIGLLRSKRYDDIESELKQFVHAAGGKTTKVILETYYLEDNEIVEAVKIVKRAGADFVKTSTGFAKGGATLEHIRLMVKAAGDSLQVKASGGIRNRKFAEELLNLGATRLGASNAHRLILRAK